MRSPLTKLILVAYLAGLAGMTSCLAADAPAGFSIEDKPKEYLDIQLDGKTVVRYMDVPDGSGTYKPYLAVFDAEGKAPITQGSGGKLYPHHRGIFIGWQSLGFDGKKINFWEMAGGNILHDKFTETKADADSATFTSLTRWVPKNSDKAAIEETRTMTFHRAPAPARLIIDFTSTLKAPNGDVELAGNVEHGGIQYRAAGDITRSETSYTFPKANADPHKDKDYPWVGETYVLGDKKYSVVEMSSPKNPTGTEWSAYRDYGRFGAYPKASVKNGESITFNYRFVITDGDMPPADYIEKQYDQFTGAATPSAVPQLTVKKGVAQ